jgi:polysaccharide export outer membrane protein
VRDINVLEALSLAGGGTEFANLDRIVILRKTADGLRALEANIKPLLRGRVNAADLDRANIVQIEAGDTIIVP